MYSIIEHTGDGINNRFPLNFTLGELRKEFVHCRVGTEVDSNGDQIFRDLEWDTASPGWVTVLGDIPGNGVIVRFSRVVPKDRLMYDFQNGAPISETSLDESNKQTLMAVHEILDMPASVIGDVTELVQAAETAADDARNSVQAVVDVARDASASADRAEAAADTLGSFIPEFDQDKVDKQLALVPQQDRTFTWNEIVIPEQTSGTPIGSEMLFPGIQPPPGWLDESIYHGQLPRALYPDLWAFALSSGNLLDDAAWVAQADAQGSCGAFSSGDGAATFRIPLLRRVFPRARDVDGSLDVGMWQGDATRKLEARLPLVSNTNPAATSGAIQFSPTPTVAGLYGQGPSAYGTFTIDSSITLPTADENRPINIVRLPIIKAWDVATVPADLEVGELVNQISAVSDRVNSETHIRELAGNRVWTSAEYQPAASSATIVTHGISDLDVNTARVEVWLKCVTTQGGWDVGDIVRDFVTVAVPGAEYHAVGKSIELTDTIVSTRMSTNIYLITKAGTSYFSATPANWRYIFKIWY